MPYLMQMVPLLMKEENKEDYEPKVVSFGPYHHGKEKLQFVEDFKPTAVQMFIGDDRNEAVFMSAILGEIANVKKCYLEKFTCRYTDIQFALMMLRDGCLILNYFGRNDVEKSYKEAETINHHLGTAVYTSIRRDMYLLENQIPFLILEILVGLRYNTPRHSFIKDMEKLSFRMFFNDKNGMIEQGVNGDLGKNSAHLLEIFRRVIVTGLDHDPILRDNYYSCVCNINTLLSYCSCRCIKDDPTTSNRKESRFYLLRSVTDLKSKGFHFRASKMQSLKGIRLRPSKFGLSAELQLPCLYVDMDTRVFFKNVMAYEFSPHFNNFDHSVSVYVTLMKRFVASKEDVRELRDKDIIINQLESDEQVVQLYKDLNTYGADNNIAFKVFWNDMESHFNSNAKMWIADFKTKYFGNPWTTITLAGSILFLFMDIVQTYFAAVPPASTK